MSFLKKVTTLIKRINKQHIARKIWDEKMSEKLRVRVTSRPPSYEENRKMIAKLSLVEQIRINMMLEGRMKLRPQMMTAPDMSDIRKEADECMQRLINRRESEGKFIKDELRDVERVSNQMSNTEISEMDIKYLRYKLHEVSDAYSDYEIAMLKYATKKSERMKKILCYLICHPKAKSSDVIEFVSNQEDFGEDI